MALLFFQFPITAARIVLLRKKKIEKMPHNGALYREGKISCLLKATAILQFWISHEVWRGKFQ